MYELNLFSRIIVPKFPENFLLKGYPLIHLDLRYFFYTGAFVNMNITEVFVMIIANFPELNDI